MGVKIIYIDEDYDLNFDYCLYAKTGQFNGRTGLVMVLTGDAEIFIPMNTYEANSILDKMFKENSVDLRNYDKAIYIDDEEYT